MIMWVVSHLEHLNSSSLAIMKREFFFWVFLCWHDALCLFIPKYQHRIVFFAFLSAAQLLFIPNSYFDAWKELPNAVLTFVRCLIFTGYKGGFQTISPPSKQNESLNNASLICSCLVNSSVTCQLFLAMQTLLLWVFLPRRSDPIAFTQSTLGCHFIC